jgi:oleandomycin transport system permease protein
MTAIAATDPAGPPDPSGPPTARRSRRITPVRAFRHSLTLAWRSVVRVRRNPEQLLDVTLQPIVLVTMFVFLFGGAIRGQSRHDYLQYVLPGIMAVTVIFASIGTGVGMNTDVAKGIFDRFRSLPISRSAPLTGTIMGDFVRYVVSVGMVFAYGSLLGFRVGTNGLWTLGAFGLMFVFGFAVGWIWLLLGLYVKSPQSLQGFGFIVLFPLTFGSNVFVPTVTLPGWLQAWVKINPVTALTSAVRGLVLGGSAIATPVWHSLAWCAAIIVVFAPLAVHRYRHIG